LAYYFFAHLVYLADSAFKYDYFHAVMGVEVQVHSADRVEKA